MSPDHQKAVLLSTAAQLELSAITQQVEAAVLRGDTDKIDALRQRAHDILDAKFDHHIAAASAARAALGA